MLFNIGKYILHSGRTTNWIINCEYLSYSELEVLAQITLEFLPEFGQVEGVPNGGLRFADVFRKYVTKGPLLIVDDVLTTGGSMEDHRKGRDAIGLVIFARGDCPAWVKYIFKTNDYL